VIFIRCFATISGSTRDRRQELSRKGPRRKQQRPSGRTTQMASRRNRKRGVRGPQMDPYGSGVELAKCCDGIWMGTSQIGP